MWMQQHSLPGFGGIPIYDVIDFIRKELKKESLFVRANAMAFSFFIALFPSVIFLFTLLPYLPIEGLRDTMRQSFIPVLPGDASNFMLSTIDELTSIPREGLLSAGLLLALFFASNGMLSMLRGFEKTYDISYKVRSGIHRRLVALQLTVILGTLFILSIAFVVFGGVLLNSIERWADIELEGLHTIQIIRWISIVIMLYAGISTLYKFGPAMKRRIRFFSPGATLATILSLLSSLGFSYYINRFDTYNQVYGSLGALIVMMLWLQINSMIILIGYELNASIKVNKALTRLKLSQRDAKQSAHQPPQR